MIVHVNTFGLCGIKGFYVDAEVNISKGLPYFEIIGMGNMAVREAVGRIKPALENMEYEFPLGRITVNLAPASVKKEGAYFDIAIAIGILKCCGMIKSDIYKYAFIGELSLDGYLRPVRGVLPMIQAAIEKGIRKCIVPVENADEASLAEKCNIYPAASLKEAVSILESNSVPWRMQHNFCTEEKEYGDFCEVKGQKEAVRAAEIAAAGGHNILFAGAPGCGKTMIASRMQGIMPELTMEESLEVTPVYSVLGMLERNRMLIKKAPFRIAYPDITKAGLLGGGGNPMPGEISLAHKGILFLDELAEFDRNVMQSLRGPIERGSIIMSRCGGFVEFPCDFMFVASTNPCKCGKLLEGTDKCICTPLQARKYLTKISKPIIDRIDMHVPVRRIYFEKSYEKSESTFDIKKRVAAARKIQKERYKNEGFNLNGRITDNAMRKYCYVTAECERFLKRVADNMDISMRGYQKILKVSRTLADLENQEKIAVDHVAEAMQYRFLDLYFKDAV